MKKKKHNMKDFSIFFWFLSMIAIFTSSSSVNVGRVSPDGYLYMVVLLVNLILYLKAAKISKRSHHHHNEKTDTSWFEHGLNLMLGE